LAYKNYHWSWWKHSLLCSLSILWECYSRFVDNSSYYWRICEESHYVELKFLLLTRLVKWFGDFPETLTYLWDNDMLLNLNRLLQDLCAF
jgi:hypothetical protein